MKVKISLCELPPGHTAIFVTDSNGTVSELDSVRSEGVFKLPVGAAIFIGAQQIEPATLTEPAPVPDSFGVIDERWKEQLMSDS